jgi:hypothetical protein
LAACSASHSSRSTAAKGVSTNVGTEPLGPLLSANAVTAVGRYQPTPGSCKTESTQRDQATQAAWCLTGAQHACGLDV